MQSLPCAVCFCNMRLETLVPHYSYFGEFRKRLGPKRLMMLFDKIKAALKNEGLIREVFKFIDASQLMTKLNVWDGREKAIKQKMDTFNNVTTAKIVADKQARFGCKGKVKHCFGYKDYVSVYMQSGLINKIAATPANVTDAQAAKHISSQESVYADKGNCIVPARQAM